MGNLVVDSERAGQTLLENDPNSKYPKCQVFDLSIESNEVVLQAYFLCVLEKNSICQMLKKLDFSQKLVSKIFRNSIFRVFFEEKYHFW